MPSSLPGIEVDLHAVCELGDRPVLSDGQQTIAVLAGVGKALGIVRARKPNGGMRPLLRWRPDCQVLVMEELAIVAEWLARPGLAEHIHAVNRARVAFFAIDAEDI